MRAITTVQATPVVELRDLLGDDMLAGLTADYDGQPLVSCWHQRETVNPVLTHWAKELRMRPPGADLRVWFRAGEGWRHVDLRWDTWQYPRVQRVPDGGWIAVDTRAREPEHNAIRFDSAGDAIGSFHAGDAIEDLQATPDGRLWVSNFDEMLSRHSDLSTGLICLDLVGRPVFRFDSLVDRDRIPSMTDCYALNVVSQREVWLHYYYGSFPLVKVVDFAVEGIWKDVGPPGSHAFAISGMTALFAPGYAGGQLRLVELSSGQRSEVRVVGSEGRPCKGRDFRPVERCSMLHFAWRGWLYSLDARDLAR